MFVCVCVCVRVHACVWACVYLCACVCVSMYELSVYVCMLVHVVSQCIHIFVISSLPFHFTIAVKLNLHTSAYALTYTCMHITVVEFFVITKIY